MRKTGLVWALAALALGQATPAVAIDDVTGTYEGKIVCSQIAGGTATKTKRTAVIGVFRGMGSFASFDVVADGTPVATALLGFIAEDAAKTDRAKLTGIQCGMDFQNKNGGTFHADVVVKPGSSKGSLKGTLIDMDAQGGVAEICTFSAKRTSTESNVTPCL